MVVWGGGGSVSGINSGGRYNPAMNSWSATNTAGAPEGRYHHTAVWTGSEMVVWGGVHTQGGSDIYLNSGGRYNPVTDSWSATSTTSAPTPRV